MKKSLLALAVIGFAGAASAQSSVTLFGIIDAAVGRVSNSGGGKVSGVSNSGINSSRLGFRGVEDLGGGLQAGFWLEGQLFNDVGQGVNATTGLNFQRRSTVSLMGNFGEIRLGRDYSPIFWNLTVYDPFGTNGVATSNAFNMLTRAGVTAANNTNGVRSDNSVGYFTPTLGGFSGQLMYSFGENTTSAIKTNNFWGIRAGYAAGPISAHVAYGKAEGGTATANINANDTKYTNVAGSFDLGVVKPMLVWAQEKTSGGAKIDAWELGATAPIGQGEVRAAFSRYDLKNSSNDWRKWGLGYVYNLSKRSALYAQYAHVSNKGLQTIPVSNNGLSAGNAVPGRNSTGYEFGIRHIF